MENTYKNIDRSVLEIIKRSPTGYTDTQMIMNLMFGIPGDEIAASLRRLCVEGKIGKQYRGDVAEYYPIK